MKLYVCFFIAILAMSTPPAQALLGAKLALLGILRNSIQGGGSSGGYGNGGSYGSGNGGGYGSGYGGGYGSGYGGGYGGAYNRPVYTGQSSNHGWGQQSYGGGYSSGFYGGYNNGLNGGNEEAVRVIKVIVNHEQPQGYYENYARNSAASASGTSWTPVPIPTYTAGQAVQSVQVSGPSSVSVPVQAQPANLLPTPVQSIQPPPRPVYVETPPQTQFIQRPPAVYQQLPVQRPIQYAVPAQPQAQQTIRLIVDGESQHAPAQTYGPPTPALTYVAPSPDNTGAYNSDSWSVSGSSNGLNSIGTGSWKRGGIRESIGC